MGRAFVPGSKAFEDRFFDGSAVVTLRVEVLEEMRTALEAVAQRQNAGINEAVRTVLARGLACLRADDYLAASSEEQSRIVGQLLELESNLAVIRYSTFGFMRDNQTLEMQNAALKNASEGLKAAVDRLQEQQEVLQARIHELQTELAAPSRDVPRASANQPATDRQAASLLKRLIGSLGCVRHDVRDRS